MTQLLTQRSLRETARCAATQLKAGDYEFLTSENEDIVALVIKVTPYTFDQATKRLHSVIDDMRKVCLPAFGEMSLDDFTNKYLNPAVEELYHRQMAGALTGTDRKILGMITRLRSEGVP